MLDIGKLIPYLPRMHIIISFSSMLDIGKLIQRKRITYHLSCFSSMLDIGKLIRNFYLMLVIQLSLF